MNSYGPHIGGPDLAALAALLADGARADFCPALLDGRAWTAIELARHAGVAASTATGHVNLPVGSRLLTQERQERHRYVRLAPYAAAPMRRTVAPLITEGRGRVKARTRQPARPTTGMIRAGRPSAGVRVQAEALAMA